MPRRRPTPRAADYSPTEAGLILNKGRATVYLWINRGKLAFTTNEFGDRRVPCAELERMQVLLNAPIGADKDLLLRQAKRRALAKSNGHLRASRLTKEEISEPLARGRRRAYENQVEARHPGLRETDPSDFERMVHEAELSHMSKMHAAWLASRLRRT